MVTRKMRAKVLGSVLVILAVFVSTYILAEKCFASRETLPPVAELTVDPQYALVDQEITLDGTGSHDMDTRGEDPEITKYEWDFYYNGSTFDVDYWEDEENYSGTLGVATHIYTSAETYTIGLRVTDNDRRARVSEVDSVTVYVRPDDGIIYVPGDVPTIQQAIDWSIDGDVVKVSEGYYPENIDFDGKAITVTSTDPYNWDVVAATVIDASGLGDAVTFDSSEYLNSVITGFTITTGYYYDGILCDEASPTISRCIVTDNSVGIRTANGSAVVDACKIHNSTYQGIMFSGGSPTVKNSLIYENGTGIGNNNENSAIITNNTIVDNTVNGIGTRNPGSDPTITNCIIWDNGKDLHDTFMPTYTCIQGWSSGTGNIDDDPCFVDADNDDYHLSSYSPCIDTGDPDFVAGPDEKDIDGDARVINDRVDMGADEIAYMPPQISVSSQDVDFFGEVGGANPGDKVLEISNGGYGTINWTISGDCGWLEVNPDNGSSAGEVDSVTLSVDTTGLTVNRYECQLEISSPEAVGSPVVVNVVLDIYNDVYYGSGDSIQAMIDAAMNIPGVDVVVVADGVYTDYDNLENIGNSNLHWDASVKHITVRSGNGPENCIIALYPNYGEQQDVYGGFDLNSNQDNSDFIRGFTIKGYSTSSGQNGWCSIPGIKCTNGASPQIENCHIRYCAKGIDTYSSEAVIRDCLIEHNGINLPGYSGAGIAGDESSLTIVDCTIRENVGQNAGGISLDSAITSPQPNSIIERCEITLNRGYGASNSAPGGIFAFHTNISIYDSIISSNFGPSGPGYYASALAFVGESHATIKNCTISNNISGGSGVIGAAVSVLGYWLDYEYHNSTASFYNCILTGNRDTSNSSDGPEYNFYLSDIDSEDLIEVYSCNVEGGQDSIHGFVIGEDVFAGDNIEVDPCFINAAEFLDCPLFQDSDHFRVYTEQPLYYDNSIDLYEPGQIIQFLDVGDYGGIELIGESRTITTVDTESNTVYFTPSMPSAYFCVINWGQNIAGVVADYHLNSDSGCIDEGEDAYVDRPTDIDGDDRIINGTVDMGADEYQG